VRTKGILSTPTLVDWPSAECYCRRVMMDITTVSTATRVLSAAEQRCSTCERELVAIVYALDRFKVCIYGHRITHDLKQVRNHIKPRGLLYTKCPGI
jgi:hypothetical protein